MRGADKSTMFRRILILLNTTFMSNNNIDTSVAPNNIVTSILQSFHLPIMKADTGASKTITRPQDKKYLQQVRVLSDGPKAILPDSTVITPSHQGYLLLHPDLSSTST